ncbi:hypothetical protein WG901_08390 [Novosphingobium sp. PS1R-30]|uniref:Uncharacterized protein n=1 Tax=Novosphingobium anseongense TaxID=3133436 RepID=A0ABU8RU75_9SPHN
MDRLTFRETREQRYSVERMADEYMLYKENLEQSFDDQNSASL